jgi:hypothetical protein
LRAEHPAVDDESVLFAEELREVDRAVLAFEGIVFGDSAPGGKGAAESGDALDLAAELDLLGEKSVAGLAVFGALVGELRFVPCREPCCEDGVVGHSVLLDETCHAAALVL